jgi:hypothetical protein
VEGYGGRGVDGYAYRPPGNHLFKDKSGGAWWIIFHESDDDPHQSRRRGDVLACSESEEELVHVRILASNVGRMEADAAFRQNAPSSYEEAVEVATRIPS